MNRLDLPNIHYQKTVSSQVSIYKFFILVEAYESHYEAHIESSELYGET